MLTTLRNALGDTRKIVLLPLISSGIYGGGIRKETYLNKYLPMVNKLLGKHSVIIHAARDSEKKLLADRGYVAVTS